MSRNSQIIQSNRSNNTTPQLSNNLGVVVEVILTEDNSNIKNRYIDNDRLDEKTVEEIGSIVVRPMHDSSCRNSKVPKVKPFDTHYTDYPIVGETVELVNINGSTYYKRIPSTNLNKGNASLDKDLLVYPLEETGLSDTTREYKEITNTGTPNAGSNNQNRKSSFGNYFQPQQINKLKPFEGDKIIQSRFGQSIRFSGYNNTNNVFSPTIIIRNGQNTQSNAKFNSVVEEDINNDGSVLLIGSGEYQSNFTATTSIKPSKFSSYPSTLKGNQFIFNSDRIIFSSKTAEMIFHSKSNYGFISDGKFSIDNGLGADLDFGGDVNITTTRSNSNITLNSGTGRLFLNTNGSGKSPNTGNSSEPLVRGNTLKQILETMIDLINAQVYRTPSGPTAIGPENRAQFNSLKRRLSEMLSTLNYTE
jgi:hypothetical protein